MIYCIAGLIGFVSSIIFLRLDFMSKLKTILHLNHAILALIQSDSSDDIKQQGILEHSWNLFKASFVLFMITFVTLVPLGFFGWIFWNEIQLLRIMLLSSIVNLAGFIVGLFLFHHKNEK
jgi:hypothetical protein